MSRELTRSVLAVGMVSATIYRFVIPTGATLELPGETMRGRSIPTEDSLPGQTIEKGIMRGQTV